MKRPHLLLLLPLVLAGCHPPESVIDAFTAGTDPVLDSVAPGPGGLADFRFHAADGNVVALHRVVLNSAVPSAPLDVAINIDPAAQKAGASFSDRRSCEGRTGRETIRAYLIDSNHHHSNPVDYTVDCGG